MAESVSKQKVKDYLDIGNKKLAKEMKEKIRSAENWSDFKSELSKLISDFSASPTQEINEKIEDLISSNFDNTSFAKEKVKKIFKDLGISSEVKTVQPVANNTKKQENNDIYRRELYHSLGLEYAGDIRRKREEKLRAKREAKYGIVRDSSKKIIAAPKVKEDGKIKKTFRRVYFKLTASMIMAPGEIPEEFLQENRELIDKTSEKLEHLMKDFEAAHKIVHDENDTRVDEISESLETPFQQMRDGNMSEKDLKRFEETLSCKLQEVLKKIKENFETLPESQIKEELKLFKNEQYMYMSKAQVSAEVEKLSKYIRDNSDSLPEKVVQEIEKDIDQYSIVMNIDEETELYHKMIIGKELQGQFENLKTIVKKYDIGENEEGHIDKKDSEKRQIALKIARKKVKSLEKAGLSRVISEGEQRNKGIVQRAQDVLLSKLEKARNAGNKEFEKTFFEPEKDELADN